ncbi:MAG: hypothetical protein JXB62_20730 [Pirellulales bacterium]|nr:hypothetical protein [Pirellulales bacterium]
MAASMPQVIDASQAYALDAFIQRTGLERAALSKARRNGLRSVRVGKGRHILGKDRLDFLSQQPAANQ